MAAERIKLTWSHDGLNPLQFLIYRSDTTIDPDDLPATIGSVDGNVREYIDSDAIVEDNVYFYRVAADFDAGVIKVSSELQTIASVSLPGLLVCAGIQRYNPSYSGPLIRVRRSSDDAELDIGQSDGDLDTVALAAFVGANSAYVVKLYDQSSAGNDFVQSTNAAQPRIVNAGSYLGHLEFDGSNDTLITTSALTYSGKALTGFGRLQRPSASGSVVEPVVGSGPTTYDSYLGGWSLYYDARTYSPTTPNWSIGTQVNAPALNSPLVICWSVDASSMTTITWRIDFSKTPNLDKISMWDNGSASILAGTRTNNSGTPDIADEKLCLGGAGSYFAKVNVQGIIICDGDQAANRGLFEGVFT